jgi:predicted ATP-dependent serine protease
LVAGEPGIGKSTLFLQNGLQLKNTSVLYISGEESEQQIKMRQTDWDYIILIFIYSPKHPLRLFFRK